ncbi:hypothetical protein, partial [Methanoregula sp.]|uniref:hypothetical protein n=1 Tax=Methanoregula sp. TaxID=2052170 RepID=UPI000CC17878
PLSCALVLTLLIFSLAMVPGCLKIAQQYSGDQPSEGSATQPHDAVEFPTAQHDPVIRTLSEITVASKTTTDLVTDAPPELTPDPYPGQHSRQFNITIDPSRYVRSPEFKKTYVLRGNSTGLSVNATSLKGPLWITFTVKPLYDCLNNPDSCKGEVKKSISRPYFALTVRDNQTRAIVAEDGYGREFSSQTENKTMKIFREGRYHLTLTGESVDVTLSITTGTAPVQSVAQASAASSAQESDLPPELREILYGGM